MLIRELPIGASGLDCAAVTMQLPTTAITRPLKKLLRLSLRIPNTPAEDTAIQRRRESVVPKCQFLKDRVTQQGDEHELQKRSH